MAMSVAVAVALARAMAIAVALAVVVVMAVAFAVVVAVMSPLPTYSPRQWVIRGPRQINGVRVFCAKTFFSGSGEGKGAHLTVFLWQLPTTTPINDY